MSTSEATPKPEPLSDDAQTLQYPSRLMVVGLILAAAALAGVVVLAALTSWWVLFALFALPPPLMMLGGPVMMTAMRGPSGSGPWGWCGPWWRSDHDRAIRPE